MSEQEAIAFVESKRRARMLRRAKPYLESHPWYLRPEAGHFPARSNVSALVFELVRSGLVEAWASPAILEEYGDVLGDDPEFVAEIVESCRVCHPLTELRVIRHESDNRFLECAFAADADYIITVNTALGHFDQQLYQTVRSVTPGEFLNFDSVSRLVRRIADNWAAAEQI